MQRRLWLVIGAMTAVVVASVAAVIAFRGEHSEPGQPSASVARAETADVAPLVEVEAPTTRDTLRTDELAAEPIDAAEWDERYRTEHLFSFAQAAAEAAMNGDGRAAWLLSLVLVECKSLLISADRRDPALRGSLAEPRLDGVKIQRCEGFRAGDPLDGLEQPDEANRPGYWRELALASGDSRALAYRAVMTGATVNDDSDAGSRASRRAMIVEDLRVAVASKDPEAIAMLSNVFLQPAIMNHYLQGPAWLLAACELGYDCSRTNPSLRSACAQSGTCDASTFADDMRRSMTAADFARAYAAGQDIAYNVRVGNWEAIQPHLAMRH